MPEATILIISGTNRPDSNAMKIARIIEGHYAKTAAKASILSLTELPAEVFQGTAYAAKPAKMVEIQTRVLAATGLHVVTPEYNGSFPGVLKYFIDMLKFPESFEGKPVAFTGEAAGVWGALRSIEQLMHIFSYRNAHIFPERVFIPQVNNVLNADGSLKEAGLNDRLAKQAAGFAGFAQHISIR